MYQKIIIWDLEGTIQGLVGTPDAHRILPGVEHLMLQQNTVNVVCSGSITDEQHGNAEQTVEKFRFLMEQLPIKVVLFSPAAGGTECWAVVKDSCCGNIDIRKAHEELRYSEYVGRFKKPDIGMLAVLKDLLAELEIMQAEDMMLMIGDTWHDQKAADFLDLPFIPAAYIHGKMSEQELRAFMNEGKSL